MNISNNNNSSLRTSIGFDGDPGRTAIINYNVPLPGSHTGRRLLELTQLSLADNDWLPAAKDIGTNIAHAISMRGGPSGTSEVDGAKAFVFWNRMAEIAGLDEERLHAIERRVENAGLRSPRLTEREIVTAFSGLTLKPIEPPCHVSIGGDCSRY